MDETGSNSLDPVQNYNVKSIPKDSGCTACVVLVTPDNIYCANAGDSRAILTKKDGGIIELSVDHKPNDPKEKERIEKAGGFVDQNRI